MTIPTNLDLFVEAYRHGKRLHIYLGDDPHSINPIERVTVEKELKADHLKIYVRAHTVVPNTVITGFQGYALSVVGRVDLNATPQTARPLRCETQMPLVPKMVPPNLPLKFERPVSDTSCPSCVSEIPR